MSNRFYQNVILLLGIKLRSNFQPKAKSIQLYIFFFWRKKLIFVFITFQITICKRIDKIVTIVKIVINYWNSKVYWNAFERAKDEIFLLLLYSFNNTKIGITKSLENWSNNLEMKSTFLLIGFHMNDTSLKFGP